MQHLIEELLDICPELNLIRGYLIFGSLSEAPPYDHSCYISWRFDSYDNPKVNSQINDKSKEIYNLIKKILKEYKESSPTPHGYFKFKFQSAEFLLTTKDVVDTILDNIEKANQLKSFRI